MKRFIKINNLLFSLLIFVQLGYTQQSMCGFDFLNEYDESTQNGCPEFFGNILVFDIPVIFHSVFDNNFENITYQEVIDVMTTLNDQLPPIQFGIYHVDINFVLADNGTSCMPGFERVYINNPKIVATDLTSLNIEESRIKSSNIWPVDKFMNIWVVESIRLGNNFVGGFAHHPDVMSQYDGIVIDDNNLNDLVHHFGHYAGLYHPWAGGCLPHYNCSNGDYVDDTYELAHNLWYDIDENSDFTCENWINGFIRPSNYFGNNTNPDCFPDVYGTWEKFKFPADNYMTYQRNCWNIFTEGQYAKMIYEFNIKRNSLINQEGNKVYIDMSENIDHSLSEFLNKAGLESTFDLYYSDKQYIIELGGNFIIDNVFPIKFSNGTVFKMKENAKISVINNSKLELNNVNLLSCEGFWDQIFVQQGCDLTIQNNSSIENAATAIVAQKRNGIDNSVVIIEDVIFKNNRVSILLEEVGTSGATYFEIKNCTFTSDENYTYQNGSIVVTRPVAGIQVNSQDYINIGHSNIFKRLSNGILLFNSNLSIENCMFEDIRKCENSPETGGSGILALNFSGGRLTANSNTFNDLDIGVKMVKGELYANGNTMNQIKQTGIDLLHCPYFNVEDNTINVDGHGIRLGFSKCDGNCYAVYPKILFNRINMVNQDAAGKGIGVVLTEKCTVENNTVETNNNDAGIYFINSYDVRVLKNWVSTNSSYRVQTNGIYLSRMEDAWLWDNNLLDEEDPSNNIGIYTESSFGSGFNCNTVDKFQHGMQFWDNCDKSLIRTNYLYDNVKDIVVGVEDALGITEGASFFGEQKLELAEGTIVGWVNLYPESMDVVHNSGDPEIVRMSRFYLNSNENAHFLPEIIESEGVWFDDNEMYQNYSIDCFGMNDTGIDPEHKCSDFITKIHTIDTNTKLDDCKKQMWKYQYFKKILEMKKAHLLSQDCVNFLIQENENVLLKIAEIEIGTKKVGGFSRMDTILTSEIKLLSERLDSLFEVEQPFPEWQATMDEYSQSWLQFQQSWKDEKREDILKIDSLLNKTKEIRVTNNCLEVLLDVLKVKLNFLRNDTLSNDEYLLVKEVAFSCPTDFGTGVYIARSLLGLFENHRFPRMEDCVIESLSKRQTKNTEHLKKISVYPNPAKKDFRIFLPKCNEEKGILTIYDVKGYQKMCVDIKDSTNSLRIESGTWNPGLYIIHYLSQTGESYVEKLSIIN